jgi:hypothetical protein
MRYGLLILCFVLAPLPVSAQIGVSLYAHTEPVPADEYIFYQLTVWNAGSMPLQNAEVVLILPDRIDSFDESPFDCPGSLCEELETATWTLGPIGVGESRSVTYWTTIESSAPSGFNLETFVTASADDVSDETFLSEVEVNRPALPLALSLSPIRAVPGDTVYATLTVGTTDTTPREEVVARLVWAEGFTFVEGTTGLLRTSTNEVSWDIGQLQPDQGARASVALLVNATPPSPLEVTATVSDAFTPSGSSKATQTIPVVAATGLVLSVIDNSGGDTDEGEIVRYTLTARNEGASAIADIVVNVLLPDHIDSFSESSGTMCPGSLCEDVEVMAWDVGGLLPGATKTLAFNVETESLVPPGFIQEVLLSASNPASYLFGMEAATLVGELEAFPPPVSTEDGPSSEGLALRVLPNPASSTAALLVSGVSAVPYRVELFDPTGRRVLSTEGIGPSPTEISVSRLPSGVYLARLTAGAAYATTTVVIAR